MQCLPVKGRYRLPLQFDNQHERPAEMASPGRMNDSVEFNWFVFKFKFYCTCSQNAIDKEAIQLTVIVQQKKTRQQYNAVPRRTPHVTVILETSLQLQSSEHNVLAKNFLSLKLAVLAWLWRHLLRVYFADRILLLQLDQEVFGYMYWLLTVLQTSTKQSLVFKFLEYYTVFINFGTVNEYQLRLERQRQVWFIPLADERAGCAGKTVRSLENACHTWAP